MNKSRMTKKAAKQVTDGIINVLLRMYYACPERHQSFEDFCQYCLTLSWEEFDKLPIEKSS